MIGLLMRLFGRRRSGRRASTVRVAGGVEALVPIAAPAGSVIECEGAWLALTCAAAIRANRAAILERLEEGRN